MEQTLFNIVIDWRAVLVQVGSMALLCTVLWFVLFKSLRARMEQRRAQIIRGVADAERAAAALKEADNKCRELLTQAALEAEQVLAAAQARRAGGGVEAAETVRDDVSHEHTTPARPAA